MSHKKSGPDRLSRFDVYWIQTNRQDKFIYRLQYYNITILQYYNITILQWAHNRLKRRNEAQ